MKSLIATLKNKKGQGATEYALILLLVVLIVVALFGPSGQLNTAISGLFTSVQDQINSVATP